MFEGHDERARAPSPVHEAGAAGDLVQPGAEAPVVPEVGEVFQGAQERLLREVVGQVAIAGATQ